MKIPTIKFGSNVISAETGYHIHDFPMVAPHQSEINKAKSINLKLNSPLGHYVHRVEKNNPISNDSIVQDITEKLETFIAENPKLLLDSYFQYWQEYPPTDNENNRILEAQYNSGLPIISSYETTFQQSVRKFENQLNYLLDNYSNRIPSPTIELGMNDVTKLEEKIDLLFVYGIKRFNVIFRSLIDYQDQWIALSKKIYGKNIWCNVVGIPSQYYSQKNKFSYVSAVFFYGAHTASLQYPRFSKNSSSKSITPKLQTSTSHIFNPDTGYFNVTSITDERARAESINELVKYCKKIQSKIESETYYTKFVPTQKHLNTMLQTIV